MEEEREYNDCEVEADCYAKPSTGMLPNSPSVVLKLRMCVGKVMRRMKLKYKVIAT